MTPRQALRQHWPEYLLEALGAWHVHGLCGPFRQPARVPSVAAPRIFARPGPTPGADRAHHGAHRDCGIIYSPWGQQSGAHLNPAVTLTFFRLGKIARWDAVFYILAQFVGGTLGVLLVAGLLGSIFTCAPVTYVATVPGELGPWVALAAEFTIALGLMLTVRHMPTSAYDALARAGVDGSAF